MSEGRRFARARIFRGLRRAAPAPYTETSRSTARRRRTGFHGGKTEMNKREKNYRRDYARRACATIIIIIIIIVIIIIMCARDVT